MPFIETNDFINVLESCMGRTETARKEIFHALYRAVECWERELQLTGSDFFRVYGQTGRRARC
ncbi:hypothetical protein, partial [Mesorhizobium sp. M7A.F.Ca.CA.001.09.2.1]|uniref:hypothetical protein n=1 Tax=Mesorhizobium sp. M7A.F.Ca.CA.001.09.2.1 TaxID=2496719 RepID=UPI0019D01BF3